VSESNGRFTAAQRERMKKWDDRRQDEIEMDQGKIVAITWTRVCSKCGRGFSASFGTRRVFDKYRYGGREVLTPRIVVQRATVCRDCERAGRKDGLEV